MGTNNILKRHGYITPCYNLYISSEGEINMYSIRSADDERMQIPVAVNSKTGKSIISYAGCALEYCGIQGLVPTLNYYICVDGANVSFELAE